MSKRYEIQEILAQDSQGVAFHATDRQTGQEVVVRRFFPFGINGGGLEASERAAYEIAVERLTNVTHPALRQVLGGGVDPVDGMPFLVTEWVEGLPLSELLTTRKLDAAEARKITELALESSLILSETFQEEDIWIETHADSIVINDANPERPITFWISPLRWLGGSAEPQSLSPIIDMIEQATGWDRLDPPQEVDSAFRWWLKKTGENASIWNLAQARKALTQHSISKTPAPKTTALPHPLAGAAPDKPASVPTPLPQPKSSKKWIAVASVSALGAALCIALVMHARNLAKESLTEWRKSPAARELSDVEKANARAIELANAAQQPSPADPEHNPLIAVVGEPSTVEARIVEVRESKSKKHRFLAFDPSAQTLVPRLRNRAKDSKFTLEELKAFEGKNVRVTGKVAKDWKGKLIIDLVDPSQIEVIPN